MTCRDCPSRVCWPAPCATRRRCSTSWRCPCRATRPGRLRCRAGETFLRHADRTPGRLRVGRFAHAGHRRGDGASRGARCLRGGEPAARVARARRRRRGAAVPAVGRRAVRDRVDGALDPDAGRPGARGRAPAADPAPARARPVGRRIGVCPCGHWTSGDRPAGDRRGVDVRRACSHPPSPSHPCRSARSGTRPIPARDFEDNKRFTPFTALYNLTGQPAVSLPLGWTGEGLPVGVMLAGRPAGEAALLAVAAQLEEAAPWHGRRPAGW